MALARLGQRHHCLCHLGLQPSNMRITSLPINNSDIVGYSACLHGPAILTLRSHCKGEPLSFYQGVDLPDAVWLYMPMGRGERIMEIQMRKRGKRMEQNNSPGLMVCDVR